MAAAVKGSEPLEDRAARPAFPGLRHLALGNGNTGRHRTGLVRGRSRRQPLSARLRRRSRDVTDRRLDGLDRLSSNHAEGMISFSRISKQYGRQVLFVDASFQLNPGEKVGLVGPNGAGKTTLFRMIVGEEAPDEGDVSVPKKLTIGYFRQDVEEMSGRSVLDEAIAGSGRVGDLHHELEALQHAMGDPARADDMDRDPRALRRGAGGVRPPRRLRARERRRARCCTASASTTSGSTATSARSRAAGRCAWRWRACCSAGPTSC